MERNKGALEEIKSGRIPVQVQHTIKCLQMKSVLERAPQASAEMLEAQHTASGCYVQ